ncbi:hypothetical protein G9A89_010943 [Geosiphon pyriformis]|nr:hypothetical protein G9A89_010943 [Geosiphon pyriformis]
MTKISLALTAALATVLIMLATSPSANGSEYEEIGNFNGNNNGNFNLGNNNGVNNGNANGIDNSNNWRGRLSGEVDESFNKDGK